MFLHSRRLCRSLALTTPRLANTGHVRKRGAVHRAAVCQCRASSERRNPLLAAEFLLDADRPELHSMDDRAISMDLLRGLPSQAAARPVSGRHSFFLAWHPYNGRAGIAAAPQARRTAYPPWLPGFHSLAGVVDVYLCVFRSGVDLCHALTPAVQSQFQSRHEYSKLRHRYRTHRFLASKQGCLENRIFPSPRGFHSLHVICLGD